jgi:hypothetical protein
MTRPADFRDCGCIPADGHTHPCLGAPYRAAVAVVIPDGYGVGLADYGIRGYTPTTYTPGTYEEARAIAARINNSMQLTPRQISEIVLSTMTTARTGEWPDRATVETYRADAERLWPR